MLVPFQSQHLFCFWLSNPKRKRTLPVKAGGFGRVRAQVRVLITNSVTQTHQNYCCSGAPWWLSSKDPAQFLFLEPELLHATSIRKKKGKKNYCGSGLDHFSQHCNSCLLFYPVPLLFLGSLFLSFLVVLLLLRKINLYYCSYLLRKVNVEVITFLVFCY